MLAPIKERYKRIEGRKGGEKSRDCRLVAYSFQEDILEIFVQSSLLLVEQAFCHRLPSISSITTIDFFMVNRYDCICIFAPISIDFDDILMVVVMVMTYLEHFVDYLSTISWR